MRRNRRPRTRRRELVVTLASVAGVLVLGAVALGVMIARLRPGLPDAAKQRVELGGPPVSVMDIRARPDGDGWVAWSGARPTCTVRGASEKEARVHLGMAAQLGLRAECQGPAGEGTGELPLAGWQPDPKQEMGADGLRWWDGTAWTLWVWSERAWGPVPEH
jgi:hypothetical protein